MVSLLSRALLLSALTAALATPCPIAILEPPPGTDIGLCSSSCFQQCHYAQETSGVCSNDPASYAANVVALGAEIVGFEVLSDKSCTIFSKENCEGDTVAHIQGPGFVNINTTAVGSVICT